MNDATLLERTNPAVMRALGVEAPIEVDFKALDPVVEVVQGFDQSDGFDFDVVKPLFQIAHATLQIAYVVGRISRYFVGQVIADVRDDLQGRNSKSHATHFQFLIDYWNGLDPWHAQVKEMAA